MINALRTPLVLGLALTLFGFATGCDSGSEAGETTAETGDTDPTGDGDGDGMTGDGDATDGSCFEQPELCDRFVSCISAIVPSQAEQVEADYGPDGTCWCGTEDEAQTCYETCFDQVETALANNPTEPACHLTSCGIDELDPTLPYGPIVDGACGDYTSEQGDMIPQLAFDGPFGVAGGFCAPKCSGLANFCPGHSQTTADGSCYINQGEDSYCVARCWVDSTIVGGTQCPCGARCQPQGSVDGEGNMRGLCTFE